MLFIEDHLFHIYNQGNNKGKLYFTRSNYLLFVRKIKEYLHPYLDILAWCLMPNHFHIMAYVRPTIIVGPEISEGEAKVSSGGGAVNNPSSRVLDNQRGTAVENSGSRVLDKQGGAALKNSGSRVLDKQGGAALKNSGSRDLDKQGGQTAEKPEGEATENSEGQMDLQPNRINYAIALMLRSYTRAINNEFERSGSLFRQKTKAVCLNPPGGHIPSWYNIGGDAASFNKSPDEHYPYVCFNYIHYNPVVANLVKEASQWEFSSAPEILGKTSFRVINRDRIAQFGLELY